MSDSSTASTCQNPPATESGKVQNEIQPRCQDYPYWSLKCRKQIQGESFARCCVSALGIRVTTLLSCYPFSPFRLDHPYPYEIGVEKGEVHKLGKHPSHDHHLLKRKIADNILGITKSIE